MNVSLSDAKARLTDLVRRAEAGEEIVLTRRGRPAVRLIPTTTPPSDRESRLRALEEFHGIWRGLPAWEGVTAANCADFLYGDDGLPA